MTYTELQEALRILGQRERCTLKELKARHRELVKRHYPDRVAGGDQEIIRNLKAAYRVIQEYVSGYRFHLPRKNFMNKIRTNASAGSSWIPLEGNVIRVHFEHSLNIL